MESADARPMISPSQGVHMVLPKEFLPTDYALMVPKTDDGRVLFAIPWHDCVVVGTTDTPIKEVSLEPRPLAEELEFLMTHAARYLSKDPKRSDVLSVFVGIRPLVKGDKSTTASLSRDHTLQVSEAKMVTICGGKWTTYRKMAEDTVSKSASVAGLPEKPCVTRNLKIHGYHENVEQLGDLRYYGSDATAIGELARTNGGLNDRLHGERTFTKAEVLWAVRNEMARTVEDFLSRRTRALILGAKESVEMAPEVARIMAQELGRDEAWQRKQVEEYTKLSEIYTMPGA
jgi:glycerol-3-phosphate dehydrogenase